MHGFYFNISRKTDKMPGYACRFFSIFVAGICGCAVCGEKDFDKLIMEKPLATAYPACFYNFSDSEFRGEARIDGTGFHVRHNVRQNICLGGAFRGEGSPVDKKATSVFYEGVVEFNRLFLTANYEPVLSRSPLTRLSVGVYPGVVLPSIKLSGDFEDDLKLQGKKVRQSIQNAFDLCVEVKLMWNPTKKGSKERTLVLRPGFSVSLGYDFTTRSRVKSRMYDSTGTIESASKEVDLGGFYLIFGVEF